MKTLIALILIVGLAAAAYWYFAGTQHKDDVQRVEEQAAKHAEQLQETVKEHLKDWHLTAPEIKQELERTGKVVRKKAQEVGSAIADATADARITAAIKAKMVKDPEVSALRVSVNTTGGVVTLSGSVNTPEAISQAMKLALETEGVNEVISTLQVNPK
jgi:hyperosmotically inducible periplasmic protein